MGTSKLENLFFLAVVGSKAYGLDTDTSDTDRIGGFILPPEEFLGIRQVSETVQKHAEDDLTLHELGKFVRLLTVGNPTVLECLFLPEVEKTSAVFDSLVDMRSRFLSKAVAGPYLGFANQQIKKLQTHKKGQRYRKNVRHCWRLLHQGCEVLTTGELTVDISEHRDFLAELEALPSDQAVALLKVKMAMLEGAKESSFLPDTVDVTFADRFVREVRVGQILDSAAGVC